jgi:hypothetical protein
MNSPAFSAAVAAVVSIPVALLTIKASSASKHKELLQIQFKEIVQKRLEFYPKLWRILVYYETNWTIDGKPKTREWAQEYLDSINEFNLEGGIFFSQAVYEKFALLRHALSQIIEEVPPKGLVSSEDITLVRLIFYGDRASHMSGMSTYLKDDLGSYRVVVLQMRNEEITPRKRIRSGIAPIRRSQIRIPFRRN